MNGRYFIFDGEKSIDKDLHIFNFEEDFYEISTVGARGVDNTIGNTGIIQNTNVTKEPLVLTFNIVQIDDKNNLIPWTNEDRQKLALWLIRDEFHELSFSNDIDRVYYALFTEVSPLFLDRAGNGFVTVTAITNANHAWTRKRIYEEEIMGKQEIEYFADASIGQKHYPTILITPRKNGTIKIHNRANGVTSVINNVRKDERILMNNKYKFILSQDKNKNIFKDFNREWFSVVPGLNLIEIEGDCHIKFEAQFPII